MSATAIVETAPIGHNNPPAPTPYEALKAHIDDLEVEANNFLDGDPIETEGQAEAVSRILDDARKARAAADAQRKIEAKPFDDGKAAVQALWTPLTDEKKGRCALIAETCKKALAPYLIKKDEAQRAAALAARQEADRQAAAAREAAEKAAASDLAGQTTARVLAENAAVAQKQADRLDKAKPQAAGGARAVGLQSRWVATIADPKAVLHHYATERRADLLQWLQEQVEKDCHVGKRNIPGVEYTETRVAI